LPDLNVAEKLIIDSLRKSEEAGAVVSSTDVKVKAWKKQLRTRILQILIAQSLHKRAEKADSMFTPAIQIL
jgi:hypothetical protein